MSVTAFAPASIGNLSVGFDVLGMAIQPVDGTRLGDTIHIETSGDQSNHLHIEGRFASKLPPNKKNIIWPCLRHFNQQLLKKGIPSQHVSMTLNKHMPIGSGLGSSACSIVATLVALNTYYQHPLTNNELLLLMGQNEALISGSLHYDNVAPSFLGGLQLMLPQPSKVPAGIIAHTLPMIEHWQFVVAYSGITVSTRMARDILPKAYPLSVVTEQTKKLGAFITGLFTRNSELALSSLEDNFAEPYRSTLLPKFNETKQHLLAHQAKAVGISGSGPTLFSIFTDTQLAIQAVDWLKEHYVQTPEGFVLLCHCDQQGAQVK